MSGAHYSAGRPRMRRVATGGWWQARVDGLRW